VIEWRSGSVELADAGEELFFGLRQLAADDHDAGVEEVNVGSGKARLSPEQSEYLAERGRDGDRGGLDGTSPNWEIVELDVDEPKVGEVLVKFVAAGRCHSDEHRHHGRAGRRDDAQFWPP
jgi:hypothetical protein